MIPFEFLNPEIQLAAKQAQSVKRPRTGCTYGMRWFAQSTKDALALLS